MNDKMNVRKYGFNLEIINNKTKKTFCFGCMSNSLAVIFSEIEKAKRKIFKMSLKGEIGKTGDKFNIPNITKKGGKQ